MNKKSFLYFFLMVCFAIVTSVTLVLLGATLHFTAMEDWDSTGIYLFSTALCAGVDALILVAIKIIKKW